MVISFSDAERASLLVEGGGGSTFTQDQKCFIGTLQSASDLL